MKVNINQIADIAGVSRGTVDKVIHNRKGVSESVREKVQKVIIDLGYKPVEHKPKPERKSIKIAVIMPEIKNPFFQTVKDGMENSLLYFHKENITVDYYYADGSNVNKIIDILNNVDIDKIDGIILRGAQSERLCKILNEFIAKKITVVLFDSDIPGCNRMCMVGENSHVSGRVAASLLAKSIDKRGDVAIIGGLPDMISHRARIQGFKEIISDKFADVRIVDVIDSRDQGVIAYEKTMMLLQQFPKLRGIFSVVGCTGDIGQALIDSNIKHVKIVCYNFTDDVIALVKRGIVDFAIGLDPYKQGKDVMNVMLEYLVNNKKPDKSFLETPILIAVDENIELLCKNKNVSLK